MLMVAAAEPPELLAYTVYIEVVRLTIGVPLRIPLEKFRPAGRAGWMDQFSTTPPL